MACLDCLIVGAPRELDQNKWAQGTNGCCKLGPGGEERACGDIFCHLPYVPFFLWSCFCCLRWPATVHWYGDARTSATGRLAGETRRPPEGASLRAQLAARAAMGGTVITCPPPSARAQIYIRQ